MNARFPPLPHKSLLRKHLRGPQFREDLGGCRDKCTGYASVAQSVEQGTENPRVIGSIPIGGTTSKVLRLIKQSCEQDRSDKRQTFSFSPQTFASQIFAGAPIMRKHYQYAAVAHLVERHLAKVEVASSSLVGRSKWSSNSCSEYGDVAKW